MKTDFDITVIGSGFGGSLLSMIARRMGLSVLLLEKGEHPRFAIGESTSPLANLMLEQLALRYDLPAILPLTTFGAWKRAYPHIGCGLKRGFTYFHHRKGVAYEVASDRGNQLMVAASPNDRVADTHWLRADVDQFLMLQAVKAGADYRDNVNLEAPQWHEEGTTTLRGAQRGVAFNATTKLVVDATGPRSFLSKALSIPESGFADYLATRGLYTHFTGVRRCESLPGFRSPGMAPYPMDDAALHHVFEGGWMWVLRFGNGITSAGVAITAALADEIGLIDGEPAWKRFLARYPAVAEQFVDATPTRPFVYAPRLTYRASRAAGRGWALLPSAAAFVDPLFSTGIPLTLSGIERLCDVLEGSWDCTTMEANLKEYGNTTLREADSTADFIGACYAAMPNFPIFTALSMFYFAASSYSEMARRLDRTALTHGFLNAGHPQFGAALRDCTAWARRLGACANERESEAFEARVSAAIACLNVAGLCDRTKRNWYGVDLNDVIFGAGKLGMSQTEMRSVLQTAIWAMPVNELPMTQSA